MYLKYRLIYESFYIYQQIKNCNKQFHHSNNIKIIIKNIFYKKLFAKLIKSEFDYICILLNKFINYLLLNAKYINYSIQELFEFIVFIYKLIEFVNSFSKVFEIKYMYFLKKRIGLRKYITMNKSIYFEKRILSKLENNKLNTLALSQKVFQ